MVDAIFELQGKNDPTIKFTIRSVSSYKNLDEIILNPIYNN